MNPPVPPVAALPPPQRSIFVTVLGWIFIVASALASVISFFTCLMFLVGSYGTSGGMTLEGLTIIAGPPVTVVAGIGLLRRKQWARLYMIALLFAVLAYNGYGIIRGPTPQSSYTSASGVPTTVLASPAQYSIPVIGVCIGLLVMLLSRSIRSEFGSSAGTTFLSALAPKSWRVGHQGRDMMYYEEKLDGTWQRIEISGEMLMGRAHHVIYFDSPDRWQSYPDWARHRRGEIIARIKSEFRAPDYEYHGEGEGGSPQASQNAAPTPVRPAPPPVVPSASPDAIRRVAKLANEVATPKQMVVLGLFVVVFLALAGGMFWLVNDGLGKDETVLPTKRATQRRSVSRQQEPTMFWVAIGLYAAIGVGSSGMGLWFIQMGWKEIRKIRRRSLDATGSNPSDKTSASSASTPMLNRKFTAADLVPGTTYRVVATFEDYDRVTHPAGETWRFLRKNFVPHDDGLSLFVERDGREVQIRLQWRPEGQARVIDGFADIVEEA